MTKDLAKAVATIAIWLGTATVLTFGLFKMTGSTEFFVITTCIIMLAAASSTAAIWLAPGAQKEPSDPKTRREGQADGFESLERAQDDVRIMRKDSV